MCDAEVTPPLKTCSLLAEREPRSDRRSHPYGDVKENGRGTGTGTMDREVNWQ
jgi:hypothetical protein